MAALHVEEAVQLGRLGSRSLAAAHIERFAGARSHAACRAAFGPGRTCVGVVHHATYAGHSSRSNAATRHAANGRFCLPQPRVLRKLRPTSTCQACIGTPRPRWRCPRCATGLRNWPFWSSATKRRPRKRDISTIAAATSGAAPARDLASKLAQQETLRERTQRTFQENTEQAHRAIAQLRPEFVDAASAMGPAIAAGDWQKALALLDDIGSKAPEEIAATLPEFLLRSALYRGASREAVLALLERNGRTLPSDAIMTMAGGRWDDLDVAAELEAWGLDPRFVDADGRNAISQLMDDFSRPTGEDVLRTSRWLDYLTSRSVSPQPAGLGLDPLDTVLFAVLDAPEPDTDAGRTDTGAGLGCSRRSGAGEPPHNRRSNPSSRPRSLHRTGKGHSRARLEG